MQKKPVEEKRAYVHYTLHPEDILFIVNSAADLGISQSQFVSAMCGLVRSMGPLHNPGIVPKA